MSGSDKLAAFARVDAAAESLLALSHEIHAHPELAFEEVRSAGLCADALEAAGFRVERGASDLETAFVASVGSGPLEIGICCEYDALPQIGHACGHNVIASAAVGAGLALAPIADELGLTVRVLGTPAEEGGGGKILMMERGSFDGLHAAMMVHPTPFEGIHMACLAVAHFDVIYTGREAHASGYPELGVNAADAITVAQVAIGLLRQHAAAGNQVHGIVTLGGAAPNIVPARAVAKYYVRARTLAELAVWQPRIEACFEAGALATGSSLEIEAESPPYSEFRVDDQMAALYRANAESVGRRFDGDGAHALTASTDMANVSLAIPSIHPTLDIDSGSAVNHQAAFTAACIRPPADKAALDGAKAMAATVIDLATSDDERARLMAHAYVNEAEPPAEA